MIRLFVTWNGIGPIKKSGILFMSDEFFALLKEYPELLPKTSRHKNVYRGPMNKLTVITYRVKLRKQQIELINIRGARQKPLK